MEYEANFEFNNIPNIEFEGNLVELPQYSANMLIDVRPSLLSQLYNDKGFITSDNVGNGTLKIYDNDGSLLCEFSANQFSNSEMVLPVGVGLVDDVKVNNVSVVENKVANIDLTGYQPIGDYATNDRVDGVVDAFDDEIEALQANKQDVISDLTAIRNNASNGQSAYTASQSYGNIVTYNASSFATAAQGAKADSALQSINSTMVVNALGFTPYNATNPSGYITQSAINTHNVDTTAHDDIRDIAEEALSRAGQAVQSIVVNTFADMEAWLRNVAHKDELKVSDNIYIKDVTVDDYWITAVLETPDAETGYYYEISPLAGEKPNISNMATTDTAQTISGDKNFTGNLKLNNYDVATQSFVTGQGYITGITGTMVTNALGYTPYNASNPDGYQNATQVNTAVTSYHDNTKQNTLVSGTNIKTVNNNSLVGSGNLDIQGLTPEQETRLTDLNVQYVSTLIPAHDLDLSTITVDKGEADYGFSYNNGELVSENIDVDESYAYGKVTITTTVDTTLTVDFRQSSEESYDFGFISYLDEYLSYSNDDWDDNAQWSGQDYGEVEDSITYDITAGEHFFTFKYRKDVSDYDNEDLFAITRIHVGETGSNKLVNYDTQEEIVINANPTNPTLNYVPYKNSNNTFGDSTLLNAGSAMAFSDKLHIGSTSPLSYTNFGRLTIYDYAHEEQVTSLALLNYGGNAGCGVSIDMYNTSANGGIPSGKLGIVDNGNYSAYMELGCKKSGAPSNPVLPICTLTSIPISNFADVSMGVGGDYKNRVLLDIKRNSSSWFRISAANQEGKLTGSGTTYTCSGTGSNNLVNQLIFAVGDMLSTSSSGANPVYITNITGTTSTTITTSATLGHLSNQYIYIKKAFFKISDGDGSTKLYVDPFGNLGIKTTTPAYDLDVTGTINASGDININGQSITIQLAGKQNVTDNTLQTTAKTIVGAINELDANKLDEITSSDVTTALGFTPYNATNPNGYQTAGQVSSAITSATSSFITKEVNNLTNYTTTTNLNTLLAGKQPVGDYATNTALTNGLATKQNEITASNKLSYSLLSDTPTIPTVPTNVSAFTNDAGYITSVYHDDTKQNVTDNTLQTTSKTIVGAINEVNAKPSMPELDEVTITTNDDDELQAIAVKDNNDNAIKTWTGTKQQYDAITTKDSNTLYNITDDQDITLTLLETIYPVGSIYITTNSTCPLSALFGTWVLVGADRVLQGAGSRGSVGNTLEESLPNIKGSFYNDGSYSIDIIQHANGAFQRDKSYNWRPENITNNATDKTCGVTFDASRSSSTYQDNAPVQQDAYLVNIYRRTA